MILPSEAELQELAGAAGLVRAAIVVEALETGTRVALGTDGAAHYPASMIKTPLAAAVALDVAAGRFGWDDPVTVDAANATLNDAPSPARPGAVLSVGTLVALMLQRSDNIATNQLIDLAGRERASALVADRLGLRDTAIRRKLSGSLPLIDDPAATGRNTHPAGDAARLFALIARDAFAGARHLGELLARSWWDVKLTRGLEPGDRFAHKTGDTDEVAHDGGILVLSNGRRFALAVYTELPSSGVNDRAFGAFMRALRPRIAA